MSGMGANGDSYNERSSMARVRANRRVQAQSASGMSPMQGQPHAQQVATQQDILNAQSIPPPPPLPAPTTTAVGSNKSNQDKALITLLAEMRDLEKKMLAQTAQYENERQQLQHEMETRQQIILSLEKSNKQLTEDKRQAEQTLRKVFTQLDRFSTGCWQFPSNSVKKMSEALHTQLQEWKRTINNEELSPEDEYLEKSTMEKMQHLHLEVKNLRAENVALKKEAYQNSMKTKDRSISARSKDDDLGSYLSGMSSTIVSESSKMKDSMKGFLNSPKSRDLTRRGKESPPSILKQSGRYDSRHDNSNVRRGGGYQHRSKSLQSLPPRRSGKKVARFAGFNDAEFDCDWGEEQSEV